VAGGAIPFSCQGPDNGFALEGAATIAWEVAEGRAGVLDRAVIQVGGGALAAACVQGLSVLAALPVIDTVQTTGAHPLERAVGRLRARAASGTGAYGTGGAGAGPGGAVDEALADAARHRSRYMWPWETEPASVATGILDDETYDWLVVARAMLATGGAPVVVGEAALEEANRLARSATGIDVNETGSAGLAGLLALARAGRVTPGSDVLVLFTGLRRPDTRLS
jgi:threonine dehydratase